MNFYRIVAICTLFYDSETWVTVIEDDQHKWAAEMGPLQDVIVRIVLAIKPYVENKILHR